MKKLLVIPLLALLTILIGCSGYKEFGPSNFEIATEADKYQGISTQANQRLVLSAHKNNTKNNMPAICAEPFPDAGSEYEQIQEFTKQLKEITQSAKNQTTFNVTLPHAIHPAVKFYRDGVFALCQAAMNGWLRTESLDKQEAKKLTEILNLEIAGQGSEPKTVFGVIAKGFGYSAKASTPKSTKPEELRKSEILVDALLRSEFERQLRDLGHATVKIFKATAGIEKSQGQLDEIVKVLNAAVKK